MPRGMVFAFFSASHWSLQNFLASALVVDANAGEARGLRLIDTNASQNAYRFILVIPSWSTPPAAFMKCRRANSKPSFARR
jgi:hypothetical protein